MTCRISLIGESILSRLWSGVIRRPPLNFERAINYSFFATHARGFDVFSNPRVNRSNKDTMLDLIQRLHQFSNSPQKPLWFNPESGIHEHSGDFQDESFDHKRNLTLIALCQIIEQNLTSKDAKWALRKNVYLSHVSKDPDKFLELLTAVSTCGNYLDGQIRQSSDLDMFHSVRWSLEHAWTASFRRGFDDSTALKWDSTAVLSTLAVYSTIRSFDDLRRSDKLEEICIKTHELMTKHDLWGADSKKSDRYYQQQPKPWDQLSDDYKANISLIVLATIAGLSNPNLENRSNRLTSVQNLFSHGDLYADLLEDTVACFRHSRLGGFLNGDQLNVCANVALRVIALERYYGSDYFDGTKMHTPLSISNHIATVANRETGLFPHWHNYLSTYSQVAEHVKDDFRLMATLAGESIYSLEQEIGRFPNHKQSNIFLMEGDNANSQELFGRSVPFLNLPSSKSIRFNDLSVEDLNL